MQHSNCHPATETNISLGRDQTIQSFTNSDFDPVLSHNITGYYTHFFLLSLL